MKNKQNLIWIDLEMTGLLPEQDRIIEIATIVTDKHLNILAEGPVFAIHQPDARLDAMDAWNTKQHGKSGLMARVQSSDVTESKAESETIAFLKQYIDKGMSPMCGNTICQDRRFLCNYMPVSGTQPVYIEEYTKLYTKHVHKRIKHTYIYVHIYI